MTVEDSLKFYGYAVDDNNRATVLITANLKSDDKFINIKREIFKVAYLQTSVSKNTFGVKVSSPSNTDMLQTSITPFRIIGYRVSQKYLELVNKCLL